MLPTPSNRPDQGPSGRPGSGWWDRFVADWQPIWSGCREAVEGLLSLLEQAGRWVLQVAELISGLHGFARDHGVRLIALAAALGISAPLTGGWGSTRFEHLPLGNWVPALVLPLAAISLRLAFGTVARESGRRAKRRENEQSDSSVARELAVNVERRQIANELLVSRNGDGLLVGQNFVYDVMAKAYIQAVGSHSSDFVLALLMQEGESLRLLATRGRIDGTLEDKIQVTWPELWESGDPFGEALEAIQYRSAPIGFTANTHNYVLLGLSGATISQQTELEISRGATALVARLAFGEEGPAWMEERI